MALTDEQIRLSLELVVIYLAFGRHYRARQRLAQSRRDAGWRPDQPVGRLGRRNDAGRRETSSGGYGPSQIRVSGAMSTSPGQTRVP